MRPINRGMSDEVYQRYQDAKPDLVEKLGTYCSYCERLIPTNLAVEHILPKDPNVGNPELENEWTNFLLSCVNCNSAKGTTVISFENYLLPDRDNTFLAFEYLETGEVEISSKIIGAEQETWAKNTRDLVGLDKTTHQNWNEKHLFTALERVTQRIATWMQAKEAREDYDNGEVNVRRVCREAASRGFFSIWMKAFEGVVEVRAKLIEEFIGTSKDCFDNNGNPISPRMGCDLENGSKL